jgi:hypothetical protein
MAAAAKNVGPRDLGVIGKDAFESGLRGIFGCCGEVYYGKATGFDGDVPWVLECAAAVAFEPQLFELSVLDLACAPRSWVRVATRERERSRCLARSVGQDFLREG